MSWNCQFIPETPEAHRDSIHHICISICTLTSHTHSTLNKLHSEWKHAACWSLMCRHCVHPSTSHIHHVAVAVCFFPSFFFFFSSNHARGPTTQYYTLLHCPITTCDMSFSFLIAVGFYIYSSTLLLLEQRSRIMKHAWRVCLPWLMDQTKTNTVFQKALHAVSKLWSRRSSHSPSQLFSTPLIYVAWLFILPLSGPFVCLVCIQKIHPCHPLPTLWHKKKKKKTEGPRRGEERQLTRKLKGKKDSSPLLCKCWFFKTFLRGKLNCLTRRGKKPSQTELHTCCSNIQINYLLFKQFGFCVLSFYICRAQWI